MNKVLPIKESGLDFRYDPVNCFHIEKSRLIKSLGDGFKRVEFIRCRKSEVLMVEAKSSFPHPGHAQDFEKNITDIYEKFRNSIDIFFSTLLKRLPDTHNEFPASFSIAECSSWNIKLILVINGHDVEGLVSINETLNQKMRREKKIWNWDKVKVQVMNEELAKDHGLVQ